MNVHILTIDVESHHEFRIFFIVSQIQDDASKQSLVCLEKSFLEPQVTDFALIPRPERVIGIVK